MNVDFQVMILIANWCLVLIGCLIMEIPNPVSAASPEVGSSDDALGAAIDAKGKEVRKLITDKVSSYFDISSLN